MQLVHEIREAVLVPKRTVKRRFRDEILSDWGRICAYCNGENACTLDHVVPKHKGGHTVRRNLVACCERCNRRKGSQDWEEWFSRQQFYCAKRAKRVRAWLKGVDPASWIPMQLSPSQT